jgi:hypothetical protein
VTDDAEEPKRKTIPAHVRLQVLMEAGYKCGNPGCRNILTLQLHHIQWVKDDGGNEPENLLPLCGYCHDQHTYGHIPAEAIRHGKGMILALNHAFDRGSTDLLLLLRKTDGETIWYSGDALLRFAGLIAANLVEFETKKLYGQTPTTSGHFGSVPTVFRGSSYELGMVVELMLTERGRMVVDAWRAGDEQRFYDALKPSGGNAKRSSEKPLTK